MATGWTIEHVCPQCGAKVEFGETDRIVACTFCRVRHYLLPAERFGYLLPAAPSAPAEGVFYAPYWRFRGMACTCHAYDVETRVADVSLCAAADFGLPASLGVRPQAMRLRFAPTDAGNRYLPVRVNPADFARHFADQIMNSREKVFFRECIGETFSLVFAPFFVDGGRLYDGVLKREIQGAAPLPDRTESASPGAARWGASFLPTLCPNCGWDMLAESESCILFCSKCNRAWQPLHGGYKPVQYELLDGPPRPAIYIPFWRMQAAVEGLSLKSQADLIRFANLPRVPTTASQRQELLFWAPAFKIQPQAFFRLSRQVMAEQPCGTSHDRLEGAALYPVTLPVHEAAENIRVTTALLAVRRKEVYPLLAQMKTTVHSYSIVYIPFIATTQDFINEQLYLSVSRMALRFGKSL